MEAFGACGPPASAPALVERYAVQGVLARPVEVDALARAGQDASRPRARLAEAAARAYATLGASEAFGAALAATVAADAAATSAAERGKASPLPRRGADK